jgi:hypothetical protein
MKRYPPSHWLERVSARSLELSPIDPGRTSWTDTEVTPLDFAVHGGHIGMVNTTDSISLNRIHSPYVTYDKTRIVAAFYRILGSKCQDNASRSVTHSHLNFLWKRKLSPIQRYTTSALHSVRTAKKTPHLTVTKIGRLTLLKEVIDVYFENHMKRVNTNEELSICWRWDIFSPLDLKGKWRPI